jgi:DNA-nicking Smr family endonuclease
VSRHKLSEHESRLFREAVADARPLQSDVVGLAPPAPPPRPLQRLADEHQVLADSLSDPPEGADLETGEELLFARPGLQHNTLRKLRRGHYAVEAQLDLHGMIVDEARTALLAFLQHARAAGTRCVRIIHGKGHGSKNRLPVLKNKVRHWLMQREDVLAFCQARTVDGGAGAVIVLLKSSSR